MSVVSGMCLEDVGALLLGSSSLMADPFGPLLDEDEESALSEGSSSPLSSSYSESRSSLSPLSPSPAASVGCKSELLSLSWPAASQLLPVQTKPGQSKGDAFSGMDWMTEKLDLNDFDLDSLIGSCDSDEPPSSPEDLLACLDADMDLDLDSLPFGGTELSLPLPLDFPLSEPVERPLEPEEIKSEPLSPARTPNPPDEVSVLQSAGIMLNLTQSHIVVLLTAKEEVSASGDSDSDSGVSVSGSPTRQPDPDPDPDPEPSPKLMGSSRTKPYSKPDLDASTPAVTGRVKAGPGAPKVVEKKLKKMEQNKTAATRYRQKKRAEQETLNSELSELEKRNRELTEKADSLSREIQYLKDLVEEVRSAKHRRSKAKVQDAVSSR